MTGREQGSEATHHKKREDTGGTLVSDPVEKIRDVPWVLVRYAPVETRSPQLPFPAGEVWCVRVLDEGKTRGQRT